jgi:hypothetical protein
MLEETYTWVDAGRTQSKWNALTRLTTIYLNHTEYLTTGNMYVLRGIARGWGQVCGRPRKQKQRGGKMNILNEKIDLR